MKYSLKFILLFCTLLAVAFAAEPVITVDLYGNVFKDGANTNQQIGDFARNNPDLAPQVDGAVREAALKARTHIADQAKAAQDQAAAQVAAKEAEKLAAITSAEQARDKAIADHTAAKAGELAALQAQVDTLTAKLKEREDFIARAAAMHLEADKANEATIAALREEVATLKAAAAAPKPQ